MNDFAAALRDLNECGVRYVVVGGLAVIRHGVVRGTKDVDDDDEPRRGREVREAHALVAAVQHLDGELLGGHLGVSHWALTTLPP